MFDYDESHLMMACKEHPDTMHELDAATGCDEEEGVEIGKPFTPPPWGWRRSTCDASSGGVCCCGNCDSDGPAFALSPSVFSNCGAAMRCAMLESPAGGKSWTPGTDMPGGISPTGEDRFGDFDENSKRPALVGGKVECVTGESGAPARASRGARLSGMFGKKRSCASVPPRRSTQNLR